MEMNHTTTADKGELLPMETYVNKCRVGTAWQRDLIEMQMREYALANLRHQAPASQPCKNECEYAVAVGMPEHHCAGKCMMLNHPDYAPAIETGQDGLAEIIKDLRHSAKVDDHDVDTIEFLESIATRLSLCVSSKQAASKQAASKQAASKQAASVQVPEERIIKAFCDDYELGHTAGWNECRAAMLAASPTPGNPIAEQDAKDAARYRWLRSVSRQNRRYNYYTFPEVDYVKAGPGENALDKAVDFARGVNYTTAMLTQQKEGAA